MGYFLIKKDYKISKIYFTLEFPTFIRIGDRVTFVYRNLETSF